MRLDGWREIFTVSPADALRFKLLQWKVQKPDYADWADAVEECVEYVVRLLAVRKNDIQGLSEDALTAQVTGHLTCFGLEAKSARVGGNCDVTVSYASEYIWLAEAKIFTGVAHVWDGYLQLSTRYNTGMINHSRGGMLLYCYKDHAEALLAEWRATLSTQLDSIAVKSCDRELAFESDEASVSTGAVYSVIHFGFPLYHEPLDGKLKLRSESLAAGRRAKKRAKSELGTR